MAKSEYLAESRRARRQRKLAQVEIPEDEVWISDELLGKGGFGEVFVAEYNTRNAAAKVYPHLDCWKFPPCQLHRLCRAYSIHRDLSRALDTVPAVESISSRPLVLAANFLSQRDD